MTPMKNVELTDWSSERQADDSHFVGSSVYRYSIYKGKLTILYILNMFLLCNFELTWQFLAIPDQA